MKKIILKKDGVLAAPDKKAGESGSLIVKQDAVGNHRLKLAAGNIGNVDIGLLPESVTQLNWLRDDENVYWTAEILTPELIINQPAQIQDLMVAIVDSNGAKIKWHAPKGNPPIADVKADKYYVYISQSEIDPNYGVTDLPAYKHSLIPKGPGEPEELVLTALIPGHKYYVTVISEKIIFGKSKLSVPSNVVSFIAAANDVSGAVAPGIIPLNPRLIYPQGLAFAEDQETGLIMTPDRLADLTGIMDHGGIPEGTPNVGMAIVMYGLGRVPMYNRPSWDTIIDLDGAWNIEYLYVWQNRNGEIDIQTSLDGVTFTTAATIGSAVEQNKWSKVMMNTIFSQNIRYVNIAFKSSEHGIRGLLFYGKRAQQGDIKGKKYKRTVDALTVDQRIGTNAFLLENENMVRKVSRHTRCYVESDWVVGRENHELGSAYDAQGNVILNVDQVKYQFESQNIWNWDLRMADFVATGQKMMLSTNNAPLYLRPKGYVRADQSKPVDPGLDPVNLAVTTNPLNYKHMARLAYNIAARFGNNPNADPQYIQLTPSDTLKRGLNVLESLEFRNEADAYWTEANGYHNWEEQAAILSAVYDGHKGAMGPGFGAKTADPELKISMSSLAVGGNIGFVKRMMLWWDLHRGYGDYPLEIINFHHYNSSSGSQTVPIYSDVPSEGVPPEQGDYFELIRKWNEFRDTQLPTVELRITEIGYDEQWGGVYAPGYRSQADRSKYKGYWLQRVFLLGFLNGCDVINQYWFSNTSVRLEELDENTKYRDVFLTCGYTDGITAFNDWNRKPLVSYWYVSNLMTEMAGYSFQHTIRMFGAQQSEGLTFDTHHPKLIALAYKNLTTQDTIIVAWLGNVGFTEGYFKLYVHPGEGSIEVIRIDNAELRKDPAGGLHNILNTQADDNGKYIELLLNECPTIIKTKNIGSGRLIEPMDVRIEAISNSVVKVAWTDANIGGNLTKIYQSSLPDQNFVEVFSGYIDDGSHIFTDLLEGSNYFYKIKFEHNGLTSGLSAAIGITTLSTLKAPVGLAASSITSSSITMRWDYSISDQQKIDLFEIFRSNTANGVYTLLAAIPKTNRTYADNGLTASTKYFYKIRAKKDFGYSEFSFSPGETTGNVVLLPPTLMTVKSNYAGDRLKLIFDMPMANPAGQETGFSIIENLAGVPAGINVSRCMLDTADPRTIYLYLSAMISNNNVAVDLSYNAGTANLQSVAGIKLAGFTSRTVLNNKNNAALLSRKIQVNLTDADNLQGAGWNDIVINTNDMATPLDAQAYTKNLKDSNGTLTDIEFILPESIEDNTNCNGYIGMEMINVNDPDFPVKTNASGVGIANLNYGGLTSLAIFQNLDSSKEYNLRVLLTVYVYSDNGATRIGYYKNWQSATYLNKNLPDKSFYLTSLKPVTSPYKPHEATGGYPVVDHINSPKVGVNFRYDQSSLWVSALILEEVLPE